MSIIIFEKFEIGARYEDGIFICLYVLFLMYVKAFHNAYILCKFRILFLSFKHGMELDINVTYRALIFRLAHV